ncbi:MAG TPA: VIT1/CCC1 transporter family protein [Polyangia bacterium]
MSDHSHPEHHEEASRGAALRNFVFGTSDGLVTVLAFVAGVSASLATRKLVLMAGVAEMFAGAVSMGLGAFLGTRAERDWYERERKREESEVAKIPHLEREELRDIYRKKGLDGETLERVVDAFTANEKRWVDIMMSEELGLQPVEGSAWSAGLIVGVSYVLAAAVPLLPYFFLVGTRALLASMAITAVGLWGIGVAKARLTQRPELRAGFETMLTGLVGTAICWSIGRVVAHIAGGVAP